MEFDGFEFEADAFLKVPSTNIQIEVCAVLKNSPQTIVGGNRPFFQKLKELHTINEQQSKDNQESSEDDKESLLIEEKLSEQNLWWNIKDKRWIFLAGDLYLNFDSFLDSSPNSNEDNYSHWNEWRPSSQCQIYEKYIHLELLTENEGSDQFGGVITSLMSLGNKTSNDVAELLHQYGLHLISEQQRIDQVMRQIAPRDKLQIKESLFNNYNSSTLLAQQRLAEIGNEYPFMYFIRRTSSRTLRGQVSSIGFNFKLTQILCENREHYLHQMLKIGYPEVFSKYTHLLLLLLNLRGEGKKTVEIKTVDNIKLECSLTPFSMPLSTFKIQGLTFTDTLRVYKFDIDSFQLKKLEAIRAQTPLLSSKEELEISSGFESDPFLQQYYKQFPKYQMQPKNYGHSSKSDCQPPFVKSEIDQQIKAEDKQMSENITQMTTERNNGFTSSNSTQIDSRSEDLTLQKCLYSLQQDQSTRQEEKEIQTPQTIFDLQGAILALMYQNNQLFSQTESQLTGNLGNNIYPNQNIFSIPEQQQTPFSIDQQQFSLQQLLSEMISIQQRYLDLNQLNLMNNLLPNYNQNQLIGQQQLFQMAMPQNPTLPFGNIPSIDYNMNLKQPIELNSPYVQALLKYGSVQKIPRQ